MDNLTIQQAIARITYWSYFSIPVELPLTPYMVLYDIILKHPVFHMNWLPEEV